MLPPSCLAQCRQHTHSRPHPGRRAHVRTTQVATIRATLSTGQLRFSWLFLKMSNKQNNHHAPKRRHACDACTLHAPPTRARKRGVKARSTARAGPASRYVWVCQREAHRAANAIPAGRKSLPPPPSALYPWWTSCCPGRLPPSAIWTPARNMWRGGLNYARARAYHCGVQRCTCISALCTHTCPIWFSTRSGR